MRFQCAPVKNDIRRALLRLSLRSQRRLELDHARGQVLNLRLLLSNRGALFQSFTLQGSAAVQRGGPLQFESQTDVVSEFLFRTLEGLGKLRPGWGVEADDEVAVVDTSGCGLRPFGIVKNKVSVSLLQRSVLDSIRVEDEEHDVAGGVDGLRIGRRSSRDVNRSELLPVVEGGLHVALRIHPEEGYQTGGVEAPTEGVCRTGWVELFVFSGFEHETVVGSVGTGEEVPGDLPSVIDSAGVTGKRFRGTRDVRELSGAVFESMRVAAGIEVIADDMVGRVDGKTDG